MRQWLSIIACTGVVLGGYTLWLWKDGRAMAAQRRSLEARYQPMADLQAESIGLRRTINQLRAREHMTLTLANSRPVLSLLGAISHAAAASDAEVYVTQLEFDTDPQGRSQLGIHGMGHTSLAVAQFLADLRRTPLFAGVEFSRTESSTNTSDQSPTFYANCEL